MTNQNLAYADTPDNSAEQQKLYRIATAQRLVIWAVLSQLLLVTLAMLAIFAKIVIPLPYSDIVMILFQLWAIYRLATAMENRLAWLLTLGTIIPIVGLFILLSTNGAATKYLQNAGLTVGLMGVNGEAIKHLKAVR